MDAKAVAYPLCCKCQYYLADSSACRRYPPVQLVYPIVDGNKVSCGDYQPIPGATK
jgi:hypothetical protein